MLLMKTNLLSAFFEIESSLIELKHFNDIKLFMKHFTETYQLTSEHIGCSSTLSWELLEKL